jgi:hypothetical protein
VKGDPTFKLHMWAFPGLGEFTHPEWMRVRTEVTAEDPEHAAEKFERIGWSGMCSIEAENGSLTHHQLAHRRTGGWTVVMREAFLAARGRPTP